MANAAGNMLLLPSWTTPISKTPPYLPYRWVPSTETNGLQCFTPSTHAGNVQNTLSNWQLSEPSELSLLSSISGTNSSSESPELPSIGIGIFGPGQWMGEHGITPFELNELPTSSGMLCISVSSSITSRVPYLRCRSNRA
ncbi:hypothetical protein PIB30_068229, partial [Stylosanthes scabra]|nr:hypothetical protein [Stylosanthes scabra]